MPESGLNQEDERLLNNFIKQIIIKDPERDLRLRYELQENLAKLKKLYDDYCALPKEEKNNPVIRNKFQDEINAVKDEIKWVCPGVATDQILNKMQGYALSQAMRNKYDTMLGTINIYMDREISSNQNFLMNKKKNDPVLLGKLAKINSLLDRIDESQQQKSILAKVKKMFTPNFISKTVSGEPTKRLRKGKKKSVFANIKEAFNKKMRR